MSVLTTSTPQRLNWKTIALCALAFWFSGSLILDLVLMPMMYMTGMTAEPGFATAGYSMFGVFNRLELLCAAIVLTGVLALRSHRQTIDHWAVPLAIGLLGIVMVYTYSLAPEMSALGLQLNLFEVAEVPLSMNQLHAEYWVLELMKLTGSGLLLSQIYRIAK
jgi:hypothetical protein